MSDSPSAAGDAMATPRPWRYSNRNWRDEVDESGNLYVTGDHRQADDEYPSDELRTEVCTGLAVVTGNRTSGGVTEANAELICRAVNAHDGLVAALRAVLDAAKNDKPGVAEAWAKARAALSAAEAR